ncbi:MULTISPECIES: DUF309 domain-containing protein [unclassified Synechocystis]|uniref:DUF309 domain-containing protein n=1 Tax=unclassified Synechocystis TaxID=2640012 RepID=UPI000AFC1B83|nr:MULTISPECIES: DUF309 domain-containing protein [unclassified Synechocystis]
MAIAIRKSKKAETGWKKNPQNTLPSLAENYLGSIPTDLILTLPSIDISTVHPLTMDENIGLSLGIEQFNRQDFYACHNTLEAVWLEANPTEKNFYQGILQIAVAHYHLGNHNWRGAVTLLGEGIRRLKGFRPDHREVDIESLFRSSVLLLENLQTITPENLPQWLESAAAEQLTPQIEIKSK